LITVLKFGGTSVQDAKAIADLVEIVQSRPGQKLVVVSALAQVTDSLIKVSKFCEDAEVQQAQHLVMDLYERHKNVA